MLFKISTHSHTLPPTQYTTHLFVYYKRLNYIVMSFRYLVCHRTKELRNSSSISTKRKLQVKRKMTTMMNHNQNNDQFNIPITASFATLEYNRDEKADVAIKVFKARRRLRELQALRQEKEASVASLLASVETASGHERTSQATYFKLKDRLESLLFDMCSSSREIREVEALKKLVVVRNREDHLTFLNLREQLRELSEEASVTIASMREMRLEALDSHRRYLEGNQRAHRDAAEQRKVLLALREEIMDLEARGKQAMLKHGKDIFHVLST